MKIKIIRVLQSMFIMLFLIAAIGLDILSKTKTWSYPDYVCVATDVSVRTLILSILMTNIIGIIAEINLIWGADIGIFVSQNMYQMIPVIWLIFENQEHNGYNCRLLPIVHYPKRRRQK